MGYKLSVNTGSAKPVFCKKPQYISYKSKINMDQLQALIINVWIENVEDSGVEESSWP